MLTLVLKSMIIFKMSHVYAYMQTSIEVLFETFHAYKMKQFRVLRKRKYGYCAILDERILINIRKKMLEALKNIFFTCRISQSLCFIQYISVYIQKMCVYINKRVVENVLRLRKRDFPLFSNEFCKQK